MNTSVSWIHEYFWILDTWILLYPGYMNTSVSWIHEYFCILDTWILLYPRYMNISVLYIHILGSITVSWIHEHLCILYPYFRKYHCILVHERLCILFPYFRKYHCILDTGTSLYSVSIFQEESLYPGYMNTSVFCIHILGSITVS